MLRRLVGVSLLCLILAAGAAVAAYPSLREHRAELRKAEREALAEAARVALRNQRRVIASETKASAMASVAVPAAAPAPSPPRVPSPASATSSTSAPAPAPSLLRAPDPTPAVSPIAASERVAATIESQVDDQAKRNREKDAAERAARNEMRRQLLTSGPVGDAAERAARSEMRRQLLKSDPVEELLATAKPAQVTFQINERMKLGAAYEARLEIARPGTKSVLADRTASNVISEKVNILDKARASIQSAHMTIVRLNDEWQEVHPGTRGYWLWKITPDYPGKIEVLVEVQHTITIDGKERILSVEHFPRTVEIDVEWWQGVGLFVASFPAAAQGAGAVVGALATIIPALYGLVVWYRKRSSPASGRGRKRRSG